MRKWIVDGDRTDHGGTVMASCTADVLGQAVARVGDKVPCPRCKTVATILHGDDTTSVDGCSVAYEGCYTTCGARLLSVRQGVAYFDDGAGASGPSEMPMTMLDAAKPRICLACLARAAQQAAAVLAR